MEADVGNSPHAAGRDRKRLCRAAEPVEQRFLHVVTLDRPVGAGLPGDEGAAVPHQGRTGGPDIGCGMPGLGSGGFLGDRGQGAEICGNPAGQGVGRPPVRKPASGADRQGTRAGARSVRRKGIRGRGTNRGAACSGAGPSITGGPGTHQDPYPTGVSQRGGGGGGYGYPKNHPPTTNRGVPSPRIVPTHTLSGLRNHPGVARGPPDQGNETQSKLKPTPKPPAHDSQSCPPPSQVSG